jgi:hypothetical protein
MKKMPFLLITILLTLIAIGHFLVLTYVFEIEPTSVWHQHSFPLPIFFWWPAALLTCSLSLHCDEPKRWLAKTLFLVITLAMFYIFFRYIFVYVPPEVNF